jgi:regulator of protease activity HflC (stomatin/prohibitin superfamily)
LENIIDRLSGCVPDSFIEIVLVVDIREKVSERSRKNTTKDNVPVTTDAILRYKIIEDRTKDAILNVENFNEMIKQVSRHLRNNIGSSVFQDILSNREEINQHVKSIISRKQQLGIEVTGVEIRQVIIPPGVGSNVDAGPKSIQNNL